MQTLTYIAHASIKTPSSYSLTPDSALANGGQQSKQLPFVSGGVVKNGLRQIKADELSEEQLNAVYGGTGDDQNTIWWLPVRL